jgi:beta-N-acetylhexosaminidase
VLKHFPGLGGASGNTDVEPASTKPYSGLDESALIPFRQAIASGMPAVMISNAIVPGLTTGPASLSYTAITTLLRDKMHFSGLVLTDSLTAVSITAPGYSLQLATVRAIEAGADEVLFNADAASVQSDNAELSAALVAAVAGGQLHRARLVQAVEDAQHAKAEVTAC